MRKAVFQLLRDSRAASAAEFALVLPLMLLLLLGMLDVGRLMWTWNRAEKATQMGVRYAVVTDPVPSGLYDYNFVGDNGLAAGDTIEATAYGSMSCSKPASNVTCICSGSCPWGATAVSTTSGPFQKIYDRMQVFLPELAVDDIKVEYAPSGLGYAGDPTGPDISPLVRVSIDGLYFQPITLLLFNAQIKLPTFSSALTMEDAFGSQSN